MHFKIYFLDVRKSNFFEIPENLEILDIQQFLRILRYERQCISYNFKYFRNSRNIRDNSSSNDWTDILEIDVPKIFEILLQILDVLLIMKTPKIPEDPKIIELLASWR